MPDDFTDAAVLCLYTEQQAREEDVWQHAGIHVQLSLVGDSRTRGHSF